VVDIDDGQVYPDRDFSTGYSSQQKFSQATSVSGPAYGTNISI
jgi:hypothetical protein